MLDVFDTLDLAENDPYLQGYRDAYIRGDIEVPELEDSIAARLDEIQRSDDPGRIQGVPADRWLSEAIDADLDRLAALKSSPLEPFEVAKMRHAAYLANAPFPSTSPQIGHFLTMQSP